MARPGTGGDVSTWIGRLRGDRRPVALHRRTTTRAKRAKPSYAEVVGRPATNTAAAKRPPKTPAPTSAPPPPRTTTKAEKQPPKTPPEAASTPHTAARGRPPTPRGSLSRKPESRLSGTPGDRKTTTTTRSRHRTDGETARERKSERFLEIKKRTYTKARKAETKHPGPSSSSGTSTTPPTAERQEEPMGVDVTSSEGKLPPRKLGLTWP